jgi:hypothetical protein
MEGTIKPTLLLTAKVYPQSALHTSCKKSCSHTNAAAAAQLVCAACYSVPHHVYTLVRMLCHTLCWCAGQYCLLTSLKFVSRAKRPCLVTPSQVPFLRASLPASRLGSSGQKCAGCVGL